MLTCLTLGKEPYYDYDDYSYCYLQAAHHRFLKQLICETAAAVELSFLLAVFGDCAAERFGRAPA